MAKAELRNEIMFKAPTHVGLLAEVSEALQEAGVNILALGAYDKGDMAEFLLLTSDNRLTGDALAPLDGEVTLAPVVVAEVDNRPGTLAVIARRLADAGINVAQIHGTSTDAPTMTLVLLTTDETRVVDLLHDL
ncbi:MAG: ACT domain-containing protein [Thermoleophilia bacterium]